MRVIAGTARSMPLTAPKGDGTRPTTDRIKETLFNVIQAYIPGGVFVDLFAGSGAVGIEALSRGAKCAYFVDNNRQALDCIGDNLKFTKLESKATVIGRNAADALFEIKEKADVVFIDPPYSLGIEKEIMKALKKSSILTGETIVIIEADVNNALEGITELGFDVYKEKIYKTNKHVFYRLTDGEDGDSV